MSNEEGDIYGYDADQTSGFNIHDEKSQEEPQNTTSETPIEEASDDEEYDPSASPPAVAKEIATESTSKTAGFVDNILDTLKQHKQLEEIGKEEAAPQKEEEEKEKDRNENDDEDEDEDEDDLYNDNSLSKEEKERETGEEEEDEDQDDEDDYDPTAGLDEKKEAPSSVSPTISSTSTAATTVTGPVLPAAFESSISKIMSSNLLKDPEFLKLSDVEKQKRILDEIRQSSASTGSANDAPANASSTHSASAQPHGRVNYRAPMSVEEVNNFNYFVDNESKYTSHKAQFVPNSRLFVGNLPANNITKQDLWRMFGVYGEILQISLKGSYGFIQYSDADAVEKAIEAEADVPLDGKDLILEIAKGSRPTQNDRIYGADKKRTRDDQGYDRNDRNQRRRKNVPECNVFVKRTADPDYARDLVRQFQNANISTEYTFLKPGMDLTKMINEVAYAGALSVVLVNKNRNCDVQVYEKTSDGGVKFDEYLSINASDAIQLLIRAKKNYFQNSAPSPSFPQVTGFNQINPIQNNVPSFNNNPLNTQIPLQQQPPQAQLNPNMLLQSLQNIPPAALQNLLALAQGIPQQQTQLGYQAAPQQQYGSPQVDMASLLSKLQPQVQPQAQVQPQSSFTNNSYNPSNYAPAYQPNNYNPQPNQPTNNGSNVQSLLDSLAKLQK